MFQIAAIGHTEILVVLGILVIIFGASQIPKIARSLGEAFKEFKKGIKDTKDIDEDEDKKSKEKK